MITRPTWPATENPPARVVDPHVHYWDVGEPGLNWPMLAPDFVYPLHRFDHDGRYALTEHRAESASIPLTKVVHVTAAEAADPVVETAWLQRMADADPAGWPNGIVGAVNLSAADAAAVIDQHGAHANFRGVRDVGLSDHLDDPDLDHGFRALAGLDLVCEAMVRLPRFDALAATADRNPDVTFVLGHGGTPVDRSGDFLDAWQTGLAALAKRTNVVCKVSGFGIGDNDWTTESLAPLVHTCIDTFGADRCIIDGNWPVDKLHSTYDELYGAYDLLTAQCSVGERDALFAANAERIYRI